jgi:hypothetical protein
MSSDRPSRLQKASALLAAGFTAWALLTFADFFPFLLDSATNPEFFNLDQLRNGLSLYAVFGLPAALFISFTLGFWAIGSALERHLTSKLDAAIAGAKVGLVAGAISLFFTVAMLMLAAFDNSSSSFSFYDYGRWVVVRDGIAPLYYWAMQLRELFVTVATGAISGLMAWWAGGFARHRPNPSLLDKS